MLRRIAGWVAAAMTVVGLSACTQDHAADVRKVQEDFARLPGVEQVELTLKTPERNLQPTLTGTATLTPETAGEQGALITQFFNLIRGLDRVTLEEMTFVLPHDSRLVSYTYPEQADVAAALTVGHHRPATVVGVTGTPGQVTLAATTTVSAATVGEFVREAMATLRFTAPAGIAGLRWTVTSTVGAERQTVACDRAPTPGDLRALGAAATYADSQPGVLAYRLRFGPSTPTQHIVTQATDREVVQRFQQALRSEGGFSPAVAGYRSGVSSPYVTLPA